MRFLRRLLNSIRNRLRRFRLIAFPPKMPTECLSGLELEKRLEEERAAKEKFMESERLASLEFDGSGRVSIKDLTRYFRNVPDLEKRLEELSRIVEDSHARRAARETQKTLEVSKSQPARGGALVVYN